MSNPFAALGIDVAQIVNDTVGTMASVDATLTKVTHGGYNISSPASGATKTTATYPCKVVQTDYLQEVVQNDSVRIVNGEIIVVLRSLPSGIFPEIGDTITLETPLGTTRAFVVNQKVRVDAAGATATCKVAG